MKHQPRVKSPTFKPPLTASTCTLLLPTFTVIRRVCDVRCGVTSKRSPFLLQISITEDGAAANFTRSFGMKSGYYLCYSKVTNRDTARTDNTCMLPTSPLFSDLVRPVFHKQTVSLCLCRTWQVVW